MEIPKIPNSVKNKRKRSDPDGSNQKLQSRRQAANNFISARLPRLKARFVGRKDIQVSGGNEKQN